MRFFKHSDETLYRKGITEGVLPCTLVPGVGKDAEEQRWIDINWGDARDGIPGIHYMLNPSRLPKDATIVEVGAWEGRDIQLFMEKNPSEQVRMHVFEPLPQKQEVLRENVKSFGRNQIEVYPYGLGDSNRTSCFTVDGNTKDEGTHENSSDNCDSTSIGVIKDAGVILASMHQIDLLHINCEGCEYEILKRILESKLADESSANSIRVIEVQFHEVISATKYCEIERLLRKSGYSIDYRFQYVWEAWVLR